MLPARQFASDTFINRSYAFASASPPRDNVVIGNLLDTVLQGRQCERTLQTTNTGLLNDDGKQ